MSGDPAGFVPLALPLALREGKPEDHGFVVSTWRTMHERSRAGQEMGPVYRDRQTRLINAILTRQSTSLRVAHVPDDADAILGWACLGPRRVYYAYVRDQVRHNGIATRLLADFLPGAISTEYTHSSGERWSAPILYGARPVVPHVHIPSAWVYDPYCNHPEG